MADKVSGTDIGHFGRKKAVSIPDTFSGAFSGAIVESSFGAVLE